MERGGSPSERFVEISKYKSIYDVAYERDLNTRSFPGSHGAVFKAFSRSSRLFGSNRKVFAIKEIHLPDQRSRTRVEFEIQFLRECKHRNILGLEDAYEIEQKDWKNTIFLVTEPWAPTSLQIFFEFVARDDCEIAVMCPWYSPGSFQPWPEIIEQCIDGLQYLHEHDIRHKDLKPANILLLNERTQGNAIGVRVILADLGISKRLIHGAETSFHGTYSFLAPEQIEKTGSTHKSDIFSLGCCFAMVKAVVHAGKDGLISIENAAMGTDSCQFANNLREVHEVLNSYITHTTSDPLELEFRNILRGLVPEMLAWDPQSRPDIVGVSHAFADYKQKRKILREGPKVLTLLVEAPGMTKVTVVELAANTSLQQLSDSISKAYRLAWARRWYRLFPYIGTRSRPELIRFRGSPSNLVWGALNPRKIPSDTELAKHSYEILSADSITVGLEVLAATIRLSQTQEQPWYPFFWEQGIPIGVGYLPNFDEILAKDTSVTAFGWGIVVEERIDLVAVVFYYHPKSVVHHYWFLIATAMGILGLVILITSSEEQNLQTLLRRHILVFLYLINLISLISQTWIYWKLKR